MYELCEVSLAKRLRYNKCVIRGILRANHGITFTEKVTKALLRQKHFQKYGCSYLFVGLEEDCQQL